MITHEPLDRDRCRCPLVLLHTFQYVYIAVFCIMGAVTTIAIVHQESERYGCSDHQLFEALQETIGRLRKNRWLHLNTP